MKTFMKKRSLLGKYNGLFRDTNSIPIPREQLKLPKKGLDLKEKRR